MKKKVILLAFIFSVLCIGIIIYACSSKDYSDKLTNYSIDATLVNEQELEAKQNMEYTNNSEMHMDKLSVHLYPNAFREGAVYKPYDAQEEGTVFFGEVNYGEISITKVMVSGKQVNVDIGGVDNNILYVPIDLDPTESVNIYIEFKLKIPKIKHRFGYTGKTINLGNWYPIVAVFENGAFREDPYYSKGDPFYSDVANYTVTITIPNNYSVATTGISTISVSGDKKVYKIQENNIRDFAFVASDQFEYLNTEVEGVNIDYLYYNDDDALNNLELIKDVIKTFNDKFGQYPYKKLTIVKTGFLHGGMEYPQIVYISDILEASTYKEVIVHEIAHQWWYSVIGNDQITHAWIDEGLAEYSTTIFYEFNPKYGITKQKRLADTLSTFLLYCDLNGFLHGKDTVMEKPLNEFSSSMEYVFMVYAKGQLLFDNLRVTLGDKMFFEGIKEYYQNNAYKTVKKEHLIGAFEKASNRKLVSFFESWVYGKVQLLG